MINLFTTCILTNSLRMSVAETEKQREREAESERKR